MSKVILPFETVRALLAIHKASLELAETIKVAAIDDSDKSHPVFDSTLDWPDLGISYFELTKILNQSDTEIKRLETIVNPLKDDSSGSKLIIEINGQQDGDLLLALSEVSRLVGDNFTEGFDRNETGSYWFQLTN